MIFSLTFPWHVTDDQSRLLCSCRLHNLKRILIHTTSIKSACYWKLQTSSLICSLTKIFCHANYYCIILIVFRGFCPIMEQRSNFLCSFFFLYATFFDIRCFFMHQQFSLFHRLTFYWFESLSLPIFQIFKISLNYSLSEKLIYFLKNHFLIQF